MTLVAVLSLTAGYVWYLQSRKLKQTRIQKATGIGLTLDTRAASGKAAASDGAAGNALRTSATPRSALTPRPHVSWLDKAIALKHSDLLVLFYSSQTGTANDLADRFAEEFTENYGVHALVIDISEESPTTMTAFRRRQLADSTPKERWVFGYFLSTYGEGEPTDGSVDWFKWHFGDATQYTSKLLKSAEPKDAYASVTYVLFGLGNRTYEHFNAVGRLFDALMARSGATRIGAAGEGDDDKSLEEDYLKWKAGVMPLMAAHYGLAAGDSRDALDARLQPYRPLFTYTPVTLGADEDEAIVLYHGEHSHVGPRRWKPRHGSPLSSSSVPPYLAEWDECLDDATAVAFNQKHPYYARIVSSKQLFRDCIDQFTFVNGTKLPFLLPSHKGRATAETGLALTREALHLELALPPGLSYATGDYVGIWACNPPHAVLALAQALGQETALDQPFELVMDAAHPSASSAPALFPMPCTLRTALAYYVDLHATLKQHQVELLGRYAQDTDERDALFALADHRDAYTRDILTPQRSLTDLLVQYSSVKLPLAVALVHMLPRNQVRYYSISSSALESPQTVALTAVVVRYPMVQPPIPSGAAAIAESIKTTPALVTDAVTGAVVTSAATAAAAAAADAPLTPLATPSHVTPPKVRIMEGTATSWLQAVHDGMTAQKAAHDPSQSSSSSSLRLNAVSVSRTKRSAALAPPPFHVAMYIRTSHFHLPADLAKPVIMVGPGTGVAPFRGFVRERAYQAQTAQPKSTAPMRLTLFYGCRHPNQDFLFRDEFTALAAQSAAGETGALQFALVTAFSRHDGAPKVYVQDRLRQHGADVYAQLAQQGGHLYVCGDASRMAQDVMKTVVAIYVQYGGMDEDAARLAVRQLKADGRYAEDTW